MATLLAQKPLSFVQDKSENPNWLPFPCSPFSLIQGASWEKGKESVCPAEISVLTLSLFQG